MSMSDVILKGTTNAPAMGSVGAFYSSKFVFSHVEWLLKVAQTITEAANHKPTLMTKIIRKKNFVYLYKMNESGQWESAYFTTQTIANGPAGDRKTSTSDAKLAAEGIEYAPSVPGGITGTFYMHQYVKTADEWERLNKMAEAYIGKDNLERWHQAGFSYRYYYDKENDIWHSLYFASRSRSAEE